MKNFVSIIIPTYNEEKHLENTLKAIKNQDCKNYEIIVSDSRSKDKTRKIAKKYGALVVVDGRNGIGAGRNFGAKFAKGDILLFVDADTILMFNTITEFLKKLSNKKVVGVTCPAIPLRFSIKNLTAYLTLNNIHKMSVKTKFPQFSGICVAYKKENFFEVNGFNEKLHVFEDIDLSTRICKTGKMIYNENTFVVTSARRLDAWGSLKFVKNYIKLYLKYLRKKKISIKDYSPIRRIS